MIGRGVESFVTAWGMIITAAKGRFHDPGADPLLAADDTASHRAEMLELVEQSL